MPPSNPSTGLGTTVKINITSTPPLLILSPTNTGQITEYQVTAHAEDVAGNVQAGVQLYYDIVAGFECAAISDTGLLQGSEPGQVVVRVSASTFNAHPGAFTPSGTPATGIVYAEQTIQVTEGLVTPDFYFTVSSLGGNQYQIQQHAETDSTWEGTVTYVLGPQDSPSSSVIGTVTNNGTLNFTSPSANFILTGTWLANGVPQTYHTCWSSWGKGTFPVQSVRASQNGFGAQGYNSASSGTPYLG